MDHDPKYPPPLHYEHDSPTVPTGEPVSLYTVRLVRTLIQTATITLPLDAGLSDAEVLEAVSEIPLALPEKDWSTSEVAAVVAAQCLQRRPRK